MSFRLAELAELVGGEVRGDGAREVDSLRTLDEAGPRDLSFLSQASYREAACASAAGGLLVPAGGELEGRDQIVVAEPALALARLVDRFHPRVAPPAGVHPTAVVADSARVDPTASVGPYCVVEEAAEVGPRVELGAHAVVGRGSRIEEDAVLRAHVVLYPGTEIGARTIVQAGVVIGSDGYGFATVDGVHHKIRHVGVVEVGSDVEIGANSTIDRAVLERTSIGDGTKIDNLVQVGHNVRIGRACLLVAQAGIAGSSSLGDGVVVAGQSGIAGHLKIGDGVMVAAKSAVFKSLEAGRKVAGVPATDLPAWRRQQARIAKLEEMARRLRQLEISNPSAGGDEA